MLPNQFPKSESLVQLPNQDQATVGSDTRSLEIDFEKSIESWLERLSLSFTHRVLASLVS